MAAPPIGTFWDIGVIEVYQPISFPDTSGADLVETALYQVVGFQDITGDAPPDYRYLHLYDAGDGGIVGPGPGETVARRSIRLTPGGNFSLTPEGPDGDRGIKFRSGLWIAVSTHPNLYLAVGANNRVWISVTGRRTGA